MKLKYFSDSECWEGYEEGVYIVYPNGDPEDVEEDADEMAWTLELGKTGIITMHLSGESMYNDGEQIEKVRFHRGTMARALEVLK